MENSGKKDTFLEKIGKRADMSDAIMGFLKGKSVQDCIDILDAVKRKILSNTVT